MPISLELGGSSTTAACLNRGFSDENGSRSGLAGKGSRHAAETCRVNLKCDQVLKDPSKTMGPHAFPKVKNSDSGHNLPHLRLWR